MGWTFTNRPKGMSNLEFFRGEFGEGVLAAASPSPAETYLAYEVKDKETGQVKGVIALICLTKWRDDYYNFGYKDMCESMGPCASNCPQKILDLLTDYDFGSEDGNRWSAEWRAKCRERIQKRRKLSAGSLVRFEKPISFNNGVSLDVAEVVSVKPLRLIKPGYPWTHYKINRADLEGATIT